MSCGTGCRVAGGFSSPKGSEGAPLEGLLVVTSSVAHSTAVQGTGWWGTGWGLSTDRQGGHHTRVLAVVSSSVHFSKHRRTVISNGTGCRMSSSL